MSRRIRSFIPAFVAAAILSLSSGCSGAGQYLREADGRGGYTLYQQEEGKRVDVAHVYKGGKVDILDARYASSEVKRGGGECESEFNWWLCFTIVYIFVILIQIMCEACAEGDSSGC